MDDDSGQHRTIGEKDIGNLRFVDALLPKLASLHEVGTARDKAHNRKLHFDHYVSLVLLTFFNPIVRSIGGIAQASTLEKVQKALGASSTSKASFSEAPTVFQPQLLEAIV